MVWPSESEPERFVLRSIIARDQREYIEKFMNNRRASRKFFGELIVYNGPLIPAYEEHNRNVHKKIAREKRRLDREVDVCLDKMCA